MHVPEILRWVDTYPLLFGSDLTLHPHSGWLPGRPFIDGNAASTMLALGHLSAEDWLHGTLPWWNPYTAAGLPLASEAQPASFFLPFILLLHFHAGVLLIKIAMQILAGLACFAFLRRIGLCVFAAFLSSVLFQCNGTFAWYADAPMLPVAFLPLLLLGLERARTCSVAARAGGQTLIALAIAYSLVAGFPEVAFIDGLLGLAWAVLRAGGLPIREQARFAAKVAAGGMIGLALAAPMLLPFLHDLRLSSLGARNLSAEAALRAYHPALILFPNIFGPPWANLGRDYFVWMLNGGYLGTVTVLLAIRAFFRPGGPAASRILFGLWAVVWLGASFDVAGIGGVVRLIPGVDQIQICRYAMPSIEFATCVLAGCALDDYRRAGGGQRLRMPLALLAASAAVALLLASRAIVADIATRESACWFAVLSMAWGLAVAGGLATLMRRPSTALRRRGIALLVCLDAVALFTPATLTGLVRPGMDNAPIQFLQDHQGMTRAVSAGNALPQNIGALYQLGWLSDEYIPVPGAWADYVRAHVDPAAWPVSFPSLYETPASMALAFTQNRAGLEALAVRYVVAPSRLNLFATQTGAGAPVRVFRNAGIDILELPGAKPYAETLGGACRLSIIDRDHMHTACDAPAQMIRREFEFPGWTARVNGHREKPRTVEEIFQGISLPAGEADIVWRYVPGNARAIAAVFGAGVLALLVTCLLPSCRSIAGAASRLGFFARPVRPSPAA